MVKIEIPINFNTEDYTEMPIGKLRKINSRNVKIFVILATVFFLVGGVSTLIVYSLDPVFAVALFTIIFGIIAIYIYLCLMFGKVILFLRELSGETETKIEKKVIERKEGDKGDGEEMPETDYEKIY